MKSAPAKPRKLKQLGYRTFRLSKRIKHSQKPLPSSLQLFRLSLGTLKSNWRFFGGITVVYGLLLVIFASGLSGEFDLQGAKDLLNESLGGEGGNLTTSIMLFSDLASSSSASNNEVVSLYQTVIVVICSLAIIWGLRQAHTKGAKTLRVKDSFYNGMYPLVPLMLVLFVIALQLIPLTLGASLYAFTVGGGIATTAAEQLLWVTLTFLLVTLSLYMVSSSIFALYIVTLPRITPVQALRSARKLVAHRRLVIIRKLLVLLIVVFVVLGLVVIPFIAFLPLAAELVFFTLSVTLLPVTHAYIYNLYRSLL